jgi:hypothetical protein
MSDAYVDGYQSRESELLQDQAGTLVDLLHSDTQYPAGSIVLEAGCGVGDGPISDLIYPKIDPKLASGIAASTVDLAPRPGLEPGTCGLTVRPVTARRAAPVNDLDQIGR